MMKYSDVFISYHREGGDDLALLIEMQLKQRGYSVFLDYHSITRGNWKQQILEQLAHTVDFVLVLTNGALKSCLNPDSYLRMEILEARRLGVNLIPVFKNGYRAPENLPQELSEVLFYQGVTFMHQYGEASVDALCRLMKSRPSPDSSSAAAIKERLPTAKAAQFPPADSVVRAYKPGDIFTFGRYPQSEIGEEKPIQWIVLEQRTDGSLALMSRYALDAKPYNTERTYVTWEMCTLRKWLNVDFYNMAFSAEERAKIVAVTLENENNPHYGTTGGKATTDTVWLLSVNEVTDDFRKGKVYSNFTDDASRMCAPTKYAAAQGVLQDEYNFIDGAGACWWWLRSPGDNCISAASVRSDGVVFISGYYVFRDSRSVRPVVVVLP